MLKFISRRASCPWLLALAVLVLTPAAARAEWRSWQTLPQSAGVITGIAPTAPGELLAITSNRRTRALSASSSSWRVVGPAPVIRNAAMASVLAAGNASRVYAVASDDSIQVRLPTGAKSTWTRLQNAPSGNTGPIAAVGSTLYRAAYDNQLYRWRPRSSAPAAWQPFGTAADFGRAADGSTIRIVAMTAIDETLYALLSDGSVRSRAALDLTGTALPATETLARQTPWESLPHAPFPSWFTADNRLRSPAVLSHDAGGNLIVAIGSGTWRVRPAARGASEFGYDVARLDNRSLRERSIPLLVVLLQYADVSFREPHTRAYYDSMLTGFPPSGPCSNGATPALPGNLCGRNIQGYFDEISNGRFRFAPRTVVATTLEQTQVCATIEKPCPGQPPKTGESWESDPWRHAYNLAISRLHATGAVDFRRFDADADGTVREGELAILLVTANRAPAVAASNRRFFTPSGCLSLSDEKGRLRVCSRIAGLQEGASIDSFLHELTHSLGILYELYGASGGVNQWLSIMAGTIRREEDRHSTYHTDPWHKMKFGWVLPMVRKIHPSWGGEVTLSAAFDAARYRPMLFYSDARGVRDFFMVEYRNHGRRPAPPGREELPIHNDRDTLGNGVAIWHVKVDEANVPVALPVPDSDATDPGVLFIGKEPDGRGTGRLWTQSDGVIPVKDADGVDSGLRIIVGPVEPQGSTVRLTYYTAVLD